MPKMTQEELLKKLDWEKARNAHETIGQLFKTAAYQPPELWGGVLVGISEQMGSMADALCLNQEMQQAVANLI